MYMQKERRALELYAGNGSSGGGGGKPEKSEIGKAGR